ncbi:LuxR C-terminal-related transcriptional regulator [Gordonia sp. CPCC 206044]|uniref:LuxR C-terminal-related transcriptional regulator n=1 Tax=Gordonia sp. CPCC 206044 TaxID=3140793 RepID=UPI003AF401A3
MERPRVRNRLDTLISNHRVTLVSAPSGYGKTVAVADWTHHTDAPVAWLSMTRRNDDPAELLRGIVSAVQNARGYADQQENLSAVRAAPGSPSNAFAQLGQAIDQMGRPLVLVIDDAHRAASVLGHPEVSSFLTDGPVDIRFVLVGHGRLAGALSRLTLHGDAALIGAPELAFTEQEIRHAAPRDLDHHDPTVIHGATEGWPIAVRLYLAGARAGVPSRVRPDHDDLLTDYIADEVLGQLEPELADFILASTTTTRVDSALAAALSERHDAPALLDQCTHRNLFLGEFAGDSDGTRVYAWHSLFAKHCRRILQQRDPQRQRQLHRCAVEHLRHTRPFIAVDLALAIDDPMLATSVVTDTWIGLVIESDAARLELVASALAERVEKRQRVELEYIRACCRGIRGDRLGADRIFREADHLAADLPAADTASLTRALGLLLHADGRDDILAARSEIVASLDDPEVATTLSPIVRAGATFMAGWIDARLRLNSDRGVIWLRTAMHDCRDAGLTGIAQRAEVNYTFALAFAGQFTEVLDVLDTSPAGSDDNAWDYYDSGIEHFTRGWVQFWRGDVHAALKSFTQTADLPPSMDGFPPLSRLYRVISAATLGDLGAVMDAEPGIGLVRDEYLHGIPWPVYLRLARARAAETRGETATVRQMIAECQDAESIPVSLALFAGILRRIGDLGAAQRMLSSLDGIQVPQYVEAYALLTSAAIAWQTGDRERAHRVLERSVMLAAPERIALPFVDNPDHATTTLLEAHLPRSTRAAFIGDCLALREPLVRRADTTATPLTRREREVLEYLRTPLTMAEIAASMFVSTNTLKSHCRSAYRKLGVTSRREAVRISESGVGSGPTPCP